MNDKEKNLRHSGPGAVTTAHEAKAREIAAEFKSTVIDEAVPEYFPKLVSAIAEALREAEAPLLKKIVELSGQIQRMEEINENLRTAVRDQPIKWNDEYYEMKLKEARLTEREACAKIADELSDSASDHEAGAALNIATDIRGRSIAELEAAIKPFADMAKRNIKPHQPDTDGCEVVMSVREMRNAVAVLEGKSDTGLGVEAGSLEHEMMEMLHSNDRARLKAEKEQGDGQ